MTDNEHGWVERNAHQWAERVCQKDYTTMPISLEEARLVYKFLDEHNASQSSVKMWTFMNHLRAYLRRKTHDNMLLESSENLPTTEENLPNE